MPDQPATSNLFNPLLVWADLGLRAAEMTVASSQTITETFDRIARAGAGADAPGRSATSDAARQPEPEPKREPPQAALGQIGNLQRSMLELMTQGWLRWMSALGAFASVPVGVGLARTVKPENPPEAVRTSLRPATWGEKPATEGQVGSLTYPSPRKQRAAAGELQHAAASGEAKPRRKAAAKRKGAGRTARKNP
jgi:hypothetical protein